MRQIETLYNIVKTELASNSNLSFNQELYGGVFASPAHETVLNERVNFYLAPRPEVGFDTQSMSEFVRSLKVEGINTMTLGSGWRELLKEGDTPMDAVRMKSFLFGGIHYHEPLEGAQDLLDPNAYLEYQNGGGSARINQLHSRREIVLHAYPTYDYANQVWLYQQTLQRGSRSDRHLDFLTHDISEEQLAALLDRPSLPLIGLPETPEFFNNYTGN